MKEDPINICGKFSYVPTSSESFAEQKHPTEAAIKKLMEEITYQIEKGFKNTKSCAEELVKNLDQWDVLEASTNASAIAICVDKMGYMLEFREELKKILERS